MLIALRIGRGDAWSTNGNGPRRLHPLPPVGGFVLPAGTDPAEVAALCRTWETTDADGRHLLRLTASAVVEQATFQ